MAGARRRAAVLHSSRQLKYSSLSSSVLFFHSLLIYPLFCIPLLFLLLSTHLSSPPLVSSLLLSPPLRLSPLLYSLLPFSPSLSVTPLFPLLHPSLLTTKLHSSYSATLQAERHLKHDHGLTTRNAQAPEGYTCGFVIEGDRKCGEHFATRAGQAKHKKDTGHVRKAARSVEQADD